MGVKNLLLFFLLTFCNYTLIAQNDSNYEHTLKCEIHSLKQQVKKLDSELDYQKEQINNQVGMLDTAFDGVSAELSASSNFIGAFGIIIAIFSIGLSIYVSRIEKNVKAMKGDNEILLQKNIQIKEELEALSAKITSDSVGLYKIVRNEESNHILDRLISVPEDINNLFESLASRDLELEHFPKLKEAYMQVKDNSLYNSNYLILFFEHFSGLALLDIQIKPEFLKSISETFLVSFKNDVLKSAKDYFNALVELGLTKSTFEINVYVKELCKSKYSENEEIYFTINNTLRSRENKFILYDSIEKTPDTLTFRKVFGNILLENKFDNLTPQESAAIDDIKNITTI